MVGLISTEITIFTRREKVGYSGRKSSCEELIITHLLVLRPVNHNKFEMKRRRE